MQNIRILPKILVILGLFAVLGAALIMAGVHGIGVMRASLDEIADDQFMSLKIAALSQEKSTRRHQLAFEILSESDLHDVAKLQAEFQAETEAFGSLRGDFGRYADGADVARLATVDAAVAKYTEMEKTFLKLVEAGNKSEAETLVQGDMSATFDQADAALEAIVAQQASDADAAQVAAGGTYSKSIMTLLAGAAMGLVLIGGTAVWIARSQIAGPIDVLRSAMAELAAGVLTITVPGLARRDEVGEMARTVQIFKEAANEKKRLEAETTAAREAQESLRDHQSAIDSSKAEDLRVFVHAVELGFDGMSAGDLTVRMNAAVAPEFEPIRAKFNDSIASLEKAIGSVVAAVGTIRVGLGQISIAAGDLSQRTEQQAASLEETVAALAEVARGINGTAGEAAQAQSVASTALKNAEKGGAIVGRAVEAMSQIEESSDKIGKIIGVIDEIAFQTNLLALNAGVEAARAGEAGRGFAVVAQEVRGLAQRSAEAAKEIKELISASSAEVARGVELVTASGRSLGEIVEQVGEMSRVVTIIAGGAREQSTSLKEVSTAADQMDKVTQQNAAMVEETTAAAQSLLSETEGLAGMVERFRTTAGSLDQASRPRAAKEARPVPTSARPTSSSPRPVAQMRTAGSGGAAPKPAVESWEEF